MADFYGIGQAFSDTVAEDFLENLKQHRPDCLDFTLLYELCTFCNPPIPNFNEVNNLSSPQNVNSLPSYGVQEQVACSFSPGRTYAQVAGHPNQNGSGSVFMNTTHFAQPQPANPSHTQGFQDIEQWMRTSTVVAASAPTNTTQLTYAQVAQQAAEQAYQKNARLRQALQPTSRSNQPRQSASRNPHISINHAPQQSQTQHRAGPACDPRTAMSPPPQHRSTLNSSLPQVHEEMFHVPLRPEFNPDPRNVSTLVQRTQRGSHRESLTPATPYGGVSTPLSPGTLSDTSFSSARSSRRTGRAQFDRTGNPYVCPQCSRTFPTADAERRHERNAHTAMSSRRHRCDYPGCGKAFTYPKDLTRHHGVHDGKAESFPCLHCPKTYTRADNLNRHVRTDHAGTDSGLGTSVSMSRSTSNTSYSFN